MQTKLKSPTVAFVIYQGSHGDRGAHRADLILPAAAYTEENGLFVNTEGRPQLAMRAGFAPGDAKENWAILRALSQRNWGRHCHMTALAQLRQALVAAQVPHLAGDDDQVIDNGWAAIGKCCLEERSIPAFRNVVSDFLSDQPDCPCVSALMADLSAACQGTVPMLKVAAE